MSSSNAYRIFEDEEPPPSYVEATGRSHANAATPNHATTTRNLSSLRACVDSLRKVEGLAKQILGPDGIKDDDICWRAGLGDGTQNDNTTRRKDQMEGIVCFRMLQCFKKSQGGKLPCFSCMKLHSRHERQTGSSVDPWMLKGPECPMGRQTFWMKSPIVSFWGSRYMTKSPKAAGFQGTKTPVTLLNGSWRQSGWSYVKCMKIVDGRVLLQISSESPIDNLSNLVPSTHFQQQVETCTHVRLSSSLSSWVERTVANLEHINLKGRWGSHRRNRINFILLGSPLTRCSRCPTEYRFRIYVKQGKQDYSTVFIELIAFVDLGRCLSVESREWTALTTQPLSEHPQTPPFNLKGLTTIEQRFCGHKRPYDGQIQGL